MIQANVARNQRLIHNNMDVLELDFKNLEWSESLSDAIRDTEIVLAADGKFIYASWCQQ